MAKIIEKIENVEKTVTLEEVVELVKNSKEGSFKGQTSFSSPLEFVSYCGRKTMRLSFTYTFNADSVHQGKIGRTYWVVLKENGKTKSVSLISDKLEIIACNIPASVALVVSSIINKQSWNWVHEQYKLLVERNDSRKASTIGKRDLPATQGNRLLDEL